MDTTKDQKDQKEQKEQKGRIITNNQKIPHIIHLATQAEWYSGANVKRDYSVTELLKPALLKRLERDYEDQIEVESADQIWSMMGSALHHVLEKGASREPGRYAVEQRFVAEFFGKLIAGGIDVYDSKEEEIQDHKYTSVWKYIYRNIPNSPTIAEWSFQLNTYRLLAQKAGIPVKKLSINLIFRDFEQKRADAAIAKGDPDEYPWTQAISVPISIMDDDEILAQIEYNISKHNATIGKEIDAIPVCSEKDRWQDKDKWAVMKQGRKSAVRVLWSYHEAQKYMEEQIPLKTRSLHYIDKREGLPKRCLQYCPVSKFCPFFKKYRADKMKDIVQDFDI